MNMATQGQTELSWVGWACEVRTRLCVSASVICVRVCAVLMNVLSQEV